ncbi:MAG: Ig-like domain-containing protein, partial [Flavobacteriales bacterium]|nr:Ig-like domain-containing protein [Flavobacteriales bacterium]
MDFPFNDGCIEYIPPAGFVGADVVLVNYCDTGDPSLCNFTWLVIEMSDDFSNGPPVVLDDDLEQVDTLYLTLPIYEPTEVCLHIEDPDENNAAIIEALSEADLDIELSEDLQCLEIIPLSMFEEPGVVTVSICDDFIPSACSELVIIIETTEVECPEIPELGNLYVPLFPNACDSLVAYCIPLDPFIADDFHFTLNGEEVETAPCRPRDYDHYQLQLIDQACEEPWPVILETIGLNNQTFTQEIQFFSEQGILNWLNDSWDAEWFSEEGNGLWALDNYYIFGDLTFTTACGSELVIPNDYQELATGQELYLDPNSISEIRLRSNAQPYCYNNQFVVTECIGNHPPFTVNEDDEIQLEFEFTMESLSQAQYCFDVVDVNDDNIDIYQLEYSGDPDNLFWEEGDNCVFFFSGPQEEGDTLTIFYCDDGDPVMCNETTLYINIWDPNYPPNAEDDYFTFDTPGGQVLDPLGNDSDPNDDALEITDVEAVNGDAVVLEDIIYYEAYDGFCGVDTLMYWICDEEPLCDSAYIYVETVLMDSDNDG